MIDIIRELHGLVPTVECLGGQEKFDRVPVVRAKRPWRGESRLSSLCEMPTQRVEGWSASFFSLLTGIMKINFWQ